MKTGVILEGIPWHDYFAECFLYFVFIGAIHVVVFIIGSLLLFLSSRKKLGVLPKRIGHFGLYLLLFLVVGSLVNGAWSCLIYGHIYDSRDYVVDFMPFWPVVINADPPQVKSYGTTLTELNVIWFAFAVFTWTATIVLYRLILKKLQNKATVHSQATTTTTDSP
jgi:hypothetical protein